MVEVLAHHRDRWAHVERFDDFLPLLSFESFDPDAWTGLARAAGMGYTVFVAKHHDGLCWWDAPGTDRTVLHDGPGRNVLAEYAAACERSGLVFGTYYSLLDWGDGRYPSDEYVDQVLHPHVLDLVERFGSKYLWGDGHWGHGPEHWRSQALIDAARDLDTEIIANDRWWLERPDVEVYEYQTPDGIVDRPWELCRGIAYSFCHNRAERAEHHMTGREIVALLTEVVAKGGNLLLNVGPAADGTIPELQAAPLRDAGIWITAHDDVISNSRPWTVWGDQHCRYTMTGERLNVIDLSGAGTFEALGRGAGRLRSIEAHDNAVIEWEQLDDRLQIRRRDRAPVDGPAVYHVELDAPPDAPIELFSSPVDVPIELAPLLAGVASGSIVQLGDGTYLGPVRVPAGVTLRGLGPDRTVIDGRESTAVTLAARRPARTRHRPRRWTADRLVPAADPRRRRAAHTRARLPRRRTRRRRRRRLPGPCLPRGGCRGEWRRPGRRLTLSFDGDALGRRRRDRRRRRSHRRELRDPPPSVRDPGHRHGRHDRARQHHRGPLVGRPSGADRGDQCDRQRVRPHDAGRRRRCRSARASDRQRGA